MEAEGLTSKPELLIIEDDTDNQRLLQMYLKRKFEVTVCDSDEAVYKCLKEKDFDIFLVDIALRSGKNGLELTKELRQTEKYSNAPIVCISAHVFPRDRANAFEAGVDEFLPRPIYNESLLISLIEVYQQKTGKKLD